jgi:hypothetical protein
MRPRPWGGRAILAAVALAAALSPASAQAAQRFATPSGGATSGSCAAGTPCELGFAVDGASAGDEVVVLPGDYSVGSLSPTVPIVLRGAVGRPRPRIVGSSGSTVLSFKEGGAVRHLALQATGALQDALTLQGGVGEDLLLRSSGGDAAKLVGSRSGTVLRDTVAHTTAAGASLAALKLRDGGNSGSGSGGGEIALRNVTAYAPGAGGAAIRCETSEDASSIVNVIARGSVADIDALKAGGNCVASHSAFRPLLSLGMAPGTANLSADPHFQDAAAGDLRLSQGSPLVDGGAFDALLGPVDPDGRPRVLGFAPDIGAYELGDFFLPGDEGGTPAEAPPPVIGETITVAPVKGKIKVRSPRGKRFRLRGVVSVPVGSLIDARRGTVAIRTALGGNGATQTGSFRGGQFRVRQSAALGGLTDIVLRGGSFRRCRTRARGRAVALASGRRGRRVRRLWSRDRGGRFRTQGRNSIATARGTAWLTVDRCDGTLTRVTEGAVEVRDRRRKRTVLVRKGREYLARARR